MIPGDVWSFNTVKMGGGKLKLLVFFSTFSGTRWNEFCQNRVILEASVRDVLVVELLLN